MNIDMTKLKRLDINDDLDILVTPSVLNPFAKVRMDDDDDEVFVVDVFSRSFCCCC